MTNKEVEEFTEDTPVEEIPEEDITQDEDDLDSHMSNVSNNTDIRNIAKADESSDIINKSKEKIIDGAQRFIDGNSNIPSININDIGSKTPILDRAYTMMVDKMSV